MHRILVARHYTVNLLSKCLYDTQMKAHTRDFRMRQAEQAKATRRLFGAGSGLLAPF